MQAAAGEKGPAATQEQIEAQAGDKTGEEASEAEEVKTDIGAGVGEEVKTDIGAGVGEEVANAMAEPGRPSPAVESDNADTSADTSAGAEEAERAEGEEKSALVTLPNAIHIEPCHW